MNVLLTSAGRRTSLLLAFKEAAHRRGGRIFAGDKDGLAPALYLADLGLHLPPIQAADYVPHLLNLVEQHNIKLIVPTIDPELFLLARFSQAFLEKGCRVLVSSEKLLDIARDKWNTAKYFSEKGFRMLNSWLPGEFSIGDLPKQLFLKPRDGSASQHTYKVHRDALMGILSRVPNAIIQEEVKAPEITIDALLDFQGRPIHYVPRLRIRTMDGESIQGVTMDDEQLRDWILGVLGEISSLGGVGPVTLQAFLTDQGLVLSEINPRFGGGIPLTLAAGGAYPEWILQMLEGGNVPPRIGEYKRDFYMTRYHVELFTENPQWR